MLKSDVCHGGKDLHGEIDDGAIWMEGKGKGAKEKRFSILFVGCRDKGFGIVEVFSIGREVKLKGGFEDGKGKSVFGLTCTASGAEELEERHEKEGIGSKGRGVEKGSVLFVFLKMFFEYSFGNGKVVCGEGMR